MGAGTRRPLLAQATMFVFFPTTAWAGIISSDFYASDRLVDPHVSPIVVYLVPIHEWPICQFVDGHYLTLWEVIPIVESTYTHPPMVSTYRKITSTPRSTNNS